MSARDEQGSFLSMVPTGPVKHTDPKERSKSARAASCARYAYLVGEIDDMRSQWERAYESMRSMSDEALLRLHNDYVARYANGERRKPRTLGTISPVGIHVDGIVKNGRGR